MTRPDPAPLRRVPGGWVAASDPAMAAMLAAVLATYTARVIAGTDAAPSTDRWDITDRN